MPYRIDVSRPPLDAFDLLVQWGALDIEPVPNGLAAILPDSVTRRQVAAQFGQDNVTVSGATGRDDSSVWLLSPRPVRAGRFLITAAEAEFSTGSLRLHDSAAFGTGHHTTTVLCIEALEEIIGAERPASILDIGTGSGILAIAALKLGVPHAVGVDIDPIALKAAAENARLNGFTEQLELIRGGPESVEGNWPLIVANVLAAPLIEMASTLAQRLGRGGRLILSGIHSSLGPEVRRAYRHFGIHLIDSETRADWVVLTGQASG